MKKYFFLIVVLVILWGCNSKTNIQIQRDDKGKISLTFKASKRYLLLPIEDIGKELKTDVLVDEKQVNSYIIRLAQKQIDYWLPLDLSAWQGKEVRLNIPQTDQTAVFLKELKQSDTFKYNYNEKYRPIYHFTPLYGWTNDPNGMVYYAGEYHLFYQFNPFGTRWQNMSWGHAVSRDLVHWEHLPVALYPDSLGTIFSGSAVVDENNTAGFQTGTEKTLLAFYTQSEHGGQWQSLAYSNDKGRTWTKYDKNPILKKASSPDFRDPKVFWYAPQNKWVMILAVGQVMEIYSSRNAIDWTYESSFGEGYGAHGGVWECPDLFELPVEENPNLKKWALICNINPGGPSGGSATQYFIGNFDGKTFSCDDKKDVTRWLDWGKDHYASVTWANAPGNRKIAIAWMSNWEYANDVPTQNFRNAMTVPSELKLIKLDNSYDLSNYPVKEMENLRQAKKELENLTVNTECNIDTLLNNNQGVFELLIDIENQSAEIIGFKLFNKQGEFVNIFISLPEKKCYVMDRQYSGKNDFSKHFASVTSAPIRAKSNYQIRLLIDKSSIECFEGQGEISMTNLVFPSEPYNRIGFYANGGKYMVKKLEIYKLQKE